MLAAEPVRGGSPNIFNPNKVLQLVALPISVADADRCLIFAPLRATMSQKSSLPQAAKSVSQVLMSDTTRHPEPFRKIFPSWPSPMRTIVFPKSSGMCESGWREFSAPCPQQRKKGKPTKAKHSVGPGPHLSDLPHQWVAARGQQHQELSKALRRRMGTPFPIRALLWQSRLRLVVSCSN
jgi:hypothetical protein